MDYPDAPGPWTTHGLPYMDHSEICGKHEFNDARTWTKEAIDPHSQYRITCDVTELIPNWTFVAKHWRRRQADREAKF